jgi:hypothetical protein
MREVLASEKSSWKSEEEPRPCLAYGVALTIPLLLLRNELTIHKMCFVYFLSLLDKSSLNYANAYGLQKNLNLVGRDYCKPSPLYEEYKSGSWQETAWIASVTNFGYLFAAWLMTILQKFPIGKVIGNMPTLWGIILMFATLAKNFAGMMMALRIILGKSKILILL